MTGRKTRPAGQAQPRWAKKPNEHLNSGKPVGQPIGGDIYLFSTAKKDKKEQMGSIFEDPFKNCSQDQPVRKLNVPDQLLVSAIILFLLCVIFLSIGWHYKSKQFPNLSEMYHQSDLIKKYYLTRDSSKRSHLTLELESGETYPIPREFLPDVKNELLRGNKVDLWVEAKGYAEVMQLNINGNTIISKDLQEDWIKTWGKWLQRISFCLFIAGCCLLIVRKRLQNIE